jgi:hypothetical protein
MFHLLSRDHISLPSTAYSRSENTRRPSVAGPVFPPALVPPPAAFGSTAQRPHLAPVAVTASRPPPAPVTAPASRTRIAHPTRPTPAVTRLPVIPHPPQPRPPTQSHQGGQKRKRPELVDLPALCENEEKKRRILCSEQQDLEMENRMTEYRASIDVEKRKASVILQLMRLQCTRVRGPLTALRWSGETIGRNGDTKSSQRR